MSAATQPGRHRRTCLTRAHLASSTCTENPRALTYHRRGASVKSIRVRCPSKPAATVVHRGQLQATAGDTDDCRKRIEELLDSDVEYQHRLEQVNDKLNQHVAEELEITVKKRLAKTVTDQSKAGQDETDQDMIDCNPKPCGKSSSSKSPTTQSSSGGAECGTDSEEFRGPASKRTRSVECARLLRAEDRWTAQDQWRALWPMISSATLSTVILCVLVCPVCRLPGASSTGLPPWRRLGRNIRSCSQT